MLDTLLDLAVEAPTSWNLQDRSIVVVSDEVARAGLARATGGQPQPTEAPVVLVFVAEPQAWREDRSDVHRQARENGAWSEEFVEMFSAASQEFQEDLERRGLLREYAVKDAVIAASFVMLAATAMGLATSPMNGWDEEQVKKVIGIDGREDLAIALLVSVGHPAGTPRRHPPPPPGPPPPPAGGLRRDVRGRRGLSGPAGPRHSRPAGGVRSDVRPSASASA
ncbi:nitroreductase family protein [Kitasatospora purpeofusca]|uniref:nitroreductase family protein n=1 Tax=Kitasatospora purpeofusca TaxID=67352 RepID=UPI0033CD15A3